MTKQTTFLAKFCLLPILFSLVSLIAIAQTNVTGRVMSTDKEPLIGATILVKGTTDIGTVTDVNGAFELKVPDEYNVLLVKYTGFGDQEIKLNELNGTSAIDITLEEASKLIDEVVVIGYARQKKSVVTGAVSSIDIAEIEARSPGQVQSSIQGKMAGITVTPTSGAPDAGFKVKIRGTGSNGPTEPLYVVDGMRTDNIRFLAPSAIKSLEILKDAASASIYGAEGANGVVLISTKNGQSGNQGISYNMQYGVQSYRGDMELMNPTQWEKYLSDSGAGTIENYGANTNWLDEIFSNAPIQRHNISFSNKIDNTTYHIGAGYFDQAGILGGSDKSKFRRFSANLGLNSKVKSWLTVGANIAYANEKSTGLTGNLDDTSIGGLISSAIMMDPTVPVTYTGNELPAFINELEIDQALLRRDKNGNIYGLSENIQGEIFNPFIALDQINGDGSTLNTLFTSVFARAEVLKNLSITTRVGMDNNNGFFHNWVPTYYATPDRNSTAATSSYNSAEMSSYQWENFATYDYDLNAQSSLSFLLGQSIYSTTLRSLNANASGLITENNDVSYIDGSELDNVVQGNKSEERLMSYFGRASLNIGGKYLLMASLRRDGTSLFQSDNRWKTYPGISAGWIISKEDFFPTDKTFSFAKLRASWGQVGSLSQIQPGAGQSLLSFRFRYPDSAGGFAPTAEASTLANNDLTWETSEQLDIGLDLGLLNDKVVFSIDYYNKQTKDLLTLGTPPNFIGGDAPFVNAGTIKNSGFEFEASYRNRDNALKYQLNANLTTLKNEVTALNNDASIIQGSANARIGTNWIPTALEVGQPAWYFRGYETMGLNSEGDVVIVDVNNDGQITPADYKYIGDPHPSLIYGGAVNLEYNNFDFTVFIQGQQGNDILMGITRTDRVTANRPTLFADSDFFAPTTDANAFTSDYMIFDGSFTRIKQIQIGYDLSDLLSNVFNNFRVYASLEDYFTFTKYPGLDPEIGSNFNDALGIDRGVYPIPGRIIFGASVNF